MQPIQGSAYLYEIEVDGVVRYVGKGSGHRFTEHMRRVRLAIKRGGDRRCLRRHGLLHKLYDAAIAGAVISQRIVEWFPSHEEAYSNEPARLAIHPPGQLWNIAAGGHGPTSDDMFRAMADPERRKRISEGVRRGLTPEVLAARRLAQLEACRRPDVRAKKSEAARRKMNDPEFRKHYDARMKEPDVRARISAAAKARPLGSERIVKLEAGRKAAFARPGFLAERQAKATAALQSHEVREKLSRKAKAMWDNPEFRARMQDRHAARLSDPAVRDRVLENLKAGRALRWKETAAP